ncbi:MAG TPA: dihydrolipoamide acetyltransferase family protein [Acidimicrobiales bacterium]|nr:dihydrolipoamide acetyltransferase family protein [Acidimicrobiales bacterium]
MADITMPQLGETVTEGTIIKWFKKVGDKVSEDETLFEVSTDKVDSEVPSTSSGYLAEILVEEGETVDVGAKLAVISDQPPGEGDGAKEDEGGQAEPEDKADAGADEDAEKEAAEAAEEEAAEDEAAEDEGAEAATADRDEDEAEPPDSSADADQPEMEGDEGTRPPRAEAEADSAEEADDGDGSSAPARQPQRSPDGEREAEAAPRSGSRVLSPVVRRLIREHDLDPSEIEGTGQQGRITRADVLAFIDKGAATAKRAPAAPKRAPEPEPEKERPAARSKPAAAGAPRSQADDEVVPFSNIRRRTAEHMIRSQATSAHVLTATEVDFEAVERVRRANKEEFKAKEGFSLTYLPFVARAVVDAIEDFPHVNASVGDNELIVHRPVHLGVAVDLNFEGLIVPVIHDADSRRLVAIARAIADLARRARSRELTADDISGGTFTITNPGPFGTFITAPVINQPQVAILSTDGVRKRPVAVELPDGSDAVAIHHVGNLALSFDHRAFDGAYAAAFLGRCKEILETRDWSQEL